MPIRTRKHTTVHVKFRERMETTNKGVRSGRMSERASEQACGKIRIIVALYNVHKRDNIKHEITLQTAIFDLG